MVKPVQRVAVLGGDGRFNKNSLPHSRVRIYQSTRYGGNGGLARLEDALKSGGIDAVVVLTRWVGHAASTRVRRLCKRRGIPMTYR